MDRRKDFYSGGRLSMEPTMKKLSWFLLLFLTACAPSVEERTILNRSNCVLPCWNGIIAGQTTRAELLEILDNLPDVDQKSIRTTDEAWNIFDDQFYFSFRQRWTLNQQPRLRGEGGIKNSVVSDLILCGEINVYMGNLVEQLGDPESIISGNNFYGGRTVILTHSQKGVSYWYTTELDSLEIAPDTSIDCIKIFDPELYEEMLEAKFFSAGYYNAEETLRVMYPWDGYGNLDEKYPPRQP
jgi:hypothetical protein